MLQVCLHPELLPKLETLQKNSGEAFKKLVSGYPKEEQQKIWNLTTYPGLVGKLGSGKNSGEELDKITSEYPEEIRATAKDYAGNRPELLNAMVSLNQNADKDFEALIKDYPDRTKEALRNLTKYPEVLNILTTNMKTTVILGDAYKNQPRELEQKLDAIAAEEARQNALDYEAWKSGLEKNPEAQKELIIFNEYLVNWNETIYIVEGAFDSIFIPNAIPMLGKFMSDHLFKKLYENAKKIVIVLDPDAWDDAERLYHRINCGKLMGKVWIVKLEGDKDIADLKGDLGEYKIKQID